MAELLFYEAQADLVTLVRGEGRMVGGRLRLTSAGLAFHPFDLTAPSASAGLDVLGAVEIDGSSGLRVARSDAPPLAFLVSDSRVLEAALEQAQKWRVDRAIYR